MEEHELEQPESAETKNFFDNFDLSNFQRKG